MSTETTLRREEASPPSAGDRLAAFHLEPAWPGQEVEVVELEGGRVLRLPVCMRVWGELPPASLVPCIVMVHGDDCALRHGGVACDCENGRLVPAEEE
jgi:hypothetical protein